MNKEKFINKLNEELEELKGKELLYFNMRDSVQEARCTNRIFGIQYALNCARLLDEPQKVTVPACAGELLDYYRNSTDVDLLVLLICFKDWYFRKDKLSENEEAIDWLVRHPEKFMKAWIDGYEVEEEPKYRVLFPCDKRKTGHQFSYLIEDGRQCYCSDLETIPELTESTIKSIDERYWPFAVPVEKV